MAVAGIISYFSMTRSLQLIDPTLVAFVRSLEIILAYIVQIFWMHQYPQLSSIIGSSIVVFCVICTSLQSKFMSILPEKIKFLFWKRDSKSIWVLDREFEYVTNRFIFFHEFWIISCYSMNYESFHIFPWIMNSFMLFHEF